MYTIKSVDGEIAEAIEVAHEKLEDATGVSVWLGDRVIIKARNIKLAYRALAIPSKF